MQVEAFGSESIGASLFNALDHLPLASFTADASEKRGLQIFPSLLELGGTALGKPRNERGAAISSEGL